MNIFKKCKLIEGPKDYCFTLLKIDKYATICRFKVSTTYKDTAEIESG